MAVLLRKLAGRYRLVQELGRGGMGVVYEAYDLVAHGPVAIKMLSSKIGDGLSAILRFKREARTTSSLSHPAICRIFEIGDYRGRPFIVMELLEGETVKRWLSRGNCEPARILDIAVQVAEGLQRAHASFIVHRDIKPANVFMTHDGVVKILDFGLAKHFVRLDPDSSLTVTEPHHTPGTVDYMSPEQLLGKRLDQRTDLYSLGVLLYEVLCGRRPFEGATTAEKIAAILDASPPPLPPIPHSEEWRQIVIERLLAKEPEHRYADAAALLRDLGLMKEIVQGVRVTLPSRTPIDASTRRPPSIVVLPFDVHARPGQEARRNAEYFSHSLVDELIVGLTRMGGVRVVPRTLATRSTGRRESIARIARRVNADLALTGVVKAMGDRLSISATLYDAAEKAGRWTRRYQGAVEDLFKLRDLIVSAVADEIHHETRSSDDRARQVDVETGRADRIRYDSHSHRSSSSPHDAETRLAAREGDRRAFHLCLKGRFFWSKAYEGGLKTARECFEEALRIDPGLALAHAGLADTYSFLGFHCLVRPRDAFAIAKTSVEQALALDGGLAEAHTSLGLLKLGGDWDWHAAVQAFRRAIELDPSHAPARIYLSWTLVLLGRFEEAYEEAERAQDIDPLSPQLNAGAAYTFFLSRNYERGIRECEKALEVDKEFLNALYVMGMCKAQLELYDEAAADLERNVELSRGMPFYLGVLGKVYADMGCRDKTLDVIRQLGEQSRKVYVPPHCHVYIHAGLGDFDTAFEWQDQAFLDGASPFNYFSPVIECLHQDPRFIRDLQDWGLDVGEPRGDTTHGSTGDLSSEQLERNIAQREEERNREKLQRLSSEIVALDDATRDSLSGLLDVTSFKSIVKLAHLVADRVGFLDSLSAVVFEDGFRRHIKERTQLHRLLADNTWVFGESFHLTMSEGSLTSALREHLKAIRHTTCVVDRAVETADGTAGRLDLMLSRRATCRANEIEHLVVELKRPRVVAGVKEITQLERYALAVSRDPRFSQLDVRWTFWLVTSDLGEYARMRRDNSNSSIAGVIQSAPGGRFVIYVRTWSEIIEENRARLEQFRRELDYAPDQETSLRVLRESYPHIFAKLEKD